MMADELLDLPEGRGESYELIEGSLMVLEPPGVHHGHVTSNIAFLLTAHARQNSLGQVLAGDPGFFTRGDDRTVRAPDVAFVSYERLPRGTLPEGYGRVAPELVVEIVSPHDRAAEVEAKIREWLHFGATAVWVVYPETRRVHVCRRDGIAVLGEDDTIAGPEALPGFAATVSAFFET